MKNMLLIIGVLSVFVLSACNGAQNGAANVVQDTGLTEPAKPESAPEAAAPDTPTPESAPTAPAQGAELRAYAKNYYAFDQATFDQALADGKTVFLDFHADWCPICNREKPHIISGFNGLDSNNVVGFEVHYNDGKETAEEKALYDRYQVRLQHTKLIINNGDVVVHSLEGWDVAKFNSEVGKYA